MKQALLIFAKNLVHGEVKTRLAATIGHEKAFAVYKELLKHTAVITSTLPVDKLLFYSDFIEENPVWNHRFQKHLQSGNDLGERMNNAFVYAFDEGYEKVVIIGTDCFELDAEIIMKAFQQLMENDVVIGPAKDGGYYLLGLKKNHAQIFHNIAWSTATVFEETVAKSKELELTHHCLQELNDIDEEKDLHHLNLSVK